MGKFIFDTERFVAECRDCLGEADSQLAVRDLLERTVSEPAAVGRGLGAVDGWRIDTLHCDDDLTILHFVWPPGTDLFPHDHQMWAAVGIYGGREDNTYFRRTGDRIERSGHREGLPGDVLLLGREGIHAVTNPTRQWTAALHVYGGNFFEMPRSQWDATGARSAFDFSAAQQVLREADTSARDAGMQP